MLSKLGQVKTQLLRLIGNWINLKWMIEPSPKIPMREQVHSQQGYQVRKRLIILGSELKEPQDHHRDQCCANLNPDGILSIFKSFSSLLKCFDQLGLCCENISIRNEVSYSINDKITPGSRQKYFLNSVFF